MNPRGDFSLHTPPANESESFVPDLMAGGVKVINGMSEFKKAISKGPAVVVFFATWCGHCKRLKRPLLDLAKKVNQENEIRKSKKLPLYSVIALDAEVNKNIGDSMKPPVEGFPMIYIYGNGGKYTVYEGPRTPRDDPNSGQMLWNALIRA